MANKSELLRAMFARMHVGGDETIALDFPQQEPSDIPGFRQGEEFDLNNPDHVKRLDDAVQKRAQETAFATKMAKASGKAAYTQTEIENAKVPGPSDRGKSAAVDKAIKERMSFMPTEDEGTVSAAETSAGTAAAPDQGAWFRKPAAATRPAQSVDPYKEAYEQGAITAAEYKARKLGGSPELSAQDKAEGLAAGALPAESGSVKLPEGGGSPRDIVDALNNRAFHPPVVRGTRTAQVMPGGSQSWSGPARPARKTADGGFVSTEYNATESDYKGPIRQTSADRYRAGKTSSGKPNNWAKWDAEHPKR